MLFNHKEVLCPSQLAVDDLNNSTVWDGVGREFATDQEALDTAMAEINAEDIEAFIASPPDQPTH